MLTIHTWQLVSNACDLRCGIDRLVVLVQQILGAELPEGHAWLFANRSGTRIKLLCCDRHGIWLAVRRLHQGRFIWPRVDAATCQLSPEQFAWLCAGIDWQRLSIGATPYGQRL